MAKHEISLFGPFQVLLNSSTGTQFESVKIHALRANLATEAVHFHSSESLAALLWPDWPQQIVRKFYGYKHASNTPRI
jgi:DNA-binding SARP family transcriptional activator